jgi:antitoxin CptB
MKTQDAGYGMQDMKQKQDQGYGIRDAKPDAAPCRSLPYPESRIPHPVLMQRVRWRARRGLLELDIVLGRFIEKHYAQLDADERQVFEVLLDMPDNPLWDMIAGRQEAAHDEQQALLEKIRAA